MKKVILIFSTLLLAVFWFQSCSDTKKAEQVGRNVQYVSGADEVTYLKLGNEIIDTVGNTLKSNLMKAMQENGPVSAVRFCNMHAMELTTVYSEKYNTEVKRVTDRNRNGNNAANETELNVLADFRDLNKSGKPLSPRVVIDADGKKNFYAPIFMGAPCLTCHGAKENMQPELVAAIDSLYPNDNAKNYSIDELRGLWSIKFKNS